MWMGLSLVVLSATCLQSHVNSKTVCDVRDYGAKADNHTLSTRSINAAIANASCQVIVLTGGGIYVSGSIRLRSKLTLSITANTILRAASNDINAYDLPEPNDWDKWQDFGHSHWHNALLWGDTIEDFTLNGGGEILGGSLASANPPQGGADKVLSLKSSSRITVTGLTLSLWPTRDCLDIVGSSHVWLDNIHCADGGDDALVFKSDYSLGAALPVFNVTVRDSSFSTVGATAVELGSESTGYFSKLRFDNITIHSAGDAGIGMAIMDGSNVRDVVYSNFYMTGVTSPIQFYIGARMLRPSPVGLPGSIRDIVIKNVTATNIINWGHGYPRNWTATLDGQPRDSEHDVPVTRVIGPNVTFENLQLTFQGGGESIDINSTCPHNRTHWMMVDEVRPAYGFFLRNAVGVTFRGVDIRFEKQDNRPCVLLDSARDISFDTFHCRRGARIDFDIGLRNGSGPVTLVRSPDIIVKQLGDA
eukprot:m.272084 g.272084  ORF g.272084 m.272084 type:complete len:475 (-) comp16106_c1_seq11:2097-3521(-)